MKYSEISQVTFSRIGQGATSRSFDLRITMRKGGDYKFNGMPKEEHAVLEEFMSLKGIRIKNEMGEEEVIVF